MGNHRQTVVSELSGRATVLIKAADFGVDLGDDHALARRVAEQVKQLEHRGYSFEGAEASFELLVHRARGHHRLSRSSTTSPWSSSARAEPWSARPP